MTSSIVVGGGDFERGASLRRLGRDVGYDDVGRLEKLALDKAVRERLGHVAAADESEFFHLTFSSDALAENCATDAHDRRAFFDRHFEVVGHSHREFA